MKYYYNIFIVFLLTIRSLTGQNTCVDTYDSYYTKVNELEGKKEYEEAILLTNKVWNYFPERKFELIKELEYLNKKTKKYKENLLLWEEGHKEGYFFFLNKQMKQYESYLFYSEFDSLVVQDNYIRDQVLKKSTTKHEVFLPFNYSSDQEYPLLIVLHGGGSNMEKSKIRWQLLDRLKSDFIVVYIQSYRHYDSKTFGWTSSDDRAHDDIERIYFDLIENYSIDTSQIIIAGTSAGGTMALDITFNETIPITGIIVFCPGKPKNMKINSDFNKSIRVYMLAGQNDYYLPKQEEIIKIFTSEHIDYLYKTIRGMGHEFPKQYDLIINDALNYLFD